MLTQDMEYGMLGIWGKGSWRGFVELKTWLTRQAAKKRRPQGQHFAMTRSVCLCLFQFLPLLLQGYPLFP